MAKLIRKRHRFKLTKNAKEIIRVYRVGPHSCMKGCTAVGSYAYSDLALAYLENIATKRVVARAIVWPDKLLYFRCYGSASAQRRLQRSLFYRGYRHGRLKGAKINYSTYGMPSIDGSRPIYNNRGYATFS